MTQQLEVRRTLVLSTAHVSAATRDEFNAAGADCSLPLIASFFYGWYLWVPPADMIEEFIDDYQEQRADVIALLRFARANGCDEIKLDADGDEVEGLQVFDWDAEEASECAATK